MDSFWTKKMEAAETERQRKVRRDLKIKPTNMFAALDARFATKQAAFKIAQLRKEGQ
jgi:hypothetical protein